MKGEKKPRKDGPKRAKKGESAYGVEEASKLLSAYLKNEETPENHKTEQFE
jgi:hypothetical protein